MEFCTNVQHPKLFSKKRKSYFCPFCEKNVPSAYNIAKDLGYDLYDYQEEILGEDGHRVLVGARQVGKTFITDLEAAAKSHQGKTIYLEMKRGAIPAIGYMVQSNISEFHNLSELFFSEEVEDAEYLVIDDVNHIEDIQEIHNLRIPENFENSLICGTPGGGVLEHLAEFEWGQQVWKIPMRKCPGISPTDEGIMRQRMNAKAEKQEIEAEFI